MQLFSYHVIRAPVYRVAARLLASGDLRHVPGLLHSECLLPMRPGHPVALPGRYLWAHLSFFALWEDEASLERFLQSPPYAVFERPGWHVRLRLYRRWGSHSSLDGATVHDELADPEGPVVGVTLARLRLLETLRFARWGKPVESQVRDHPGSSKVTVAFRPMNTFSTFSLWRSEEDMLGMVHGGRSDVDGTPHRDAMIERSRRPFHHEFTTMRFVLVSEHGRWPGQASSGPAEVKRSPHRRD